MKHPVFRVAKNWADRNRIRPVIVKVCSCGKQFIGLPAGTKYQHDPDGDLSGWYFDCDRCHSTCFVPDDKGAA